MITHAENTQMMHEKLAYQPPEIVDFGTIETLTQGGLSSKTGNLLGVDPSSNLTCLDLDC